MDFVEENKLKRRAYLIGRTESRIDELRIFIKFKLDMKADYFTLQYLKKTLDANIELRKLLFNEEDNDLIH